MLNINDKVLIYYPRVKENIQNQLNNIKMNNKFIVEEIMDNEIKEMEQYDKDNGISRIITKISYRDYLQKKITRYELDNKFCYYEEELIKIK